MRMYDLLEKKRDGKELSTQEIFWMIDEYVKGNIPDYQMSAMLMAIFLKGMTDREVGDLTLSMAQSGEQIDLSAIQGIKVDKHSTGGVGDKTTFIVGSIVAACGGKVAKMSGRGLGHTGGTIDKMESIPGIRSSLPKNEFVEIVNQVGLCVIGQSGELAPADKMLYALRDVTGTVESIPLIASSIMSKKLAAGSDAIVLDVKVGQGAFMKNLDDAILLATKMVDIGTRYNKSTMALITDMDKPLGMNIGNSLEIEEAISILHNQGSLALKEECIAIAADMLCISGRGNRAECEIMAKKALQDGSAFSVFCRMVEAQGGDTAVLHDPAQLAKAPYTLDVRATSSGYIEQMDALACGRAAAILGAGRITKESAIDLGAGIILHKTVGDVVAKDDIIATLYSSQQALLQEGKLCLCKGISYVATKPVSRPAIYARVTKDGVERYV